MSTRINDAFNLAPDAVKAMRDLEIAIKKSGLEHGLIELVKMRASQINECAFCIHMHATDARNHGETEMRLYMLNAWRESTLYTPRERAALAWTEALTLIAATGAPDGDYDLVRTEFSESELVHLTFLIGAINVWNRVQVGLRVPHAVDAADKPANANDAA